MIQTEPVPSAVLQGVGADRWCVHAPQWVGVQGMHVAPPAFQISPTLPAVSEGGAVHGHNSHFSGGWGRGDWSRGGISWSLRPAMVATPVWALAHLCLIPAGWTNIRLGVIISVPHPTVGKLHLSHALNASTFVIIQIA